MILSLSNNKKYREESKFKQTLKNIMNRSKENNNFNYKQLKDLQTYQKLSKKYKKI